MEIYVFLLSTMSVGRITLQGAGEVGVPHLKLEGQDPGGDWNDLSGNWTREQWKGSDLLVLLAATDFLRNRGITHFAFREDNIVASKVKSGFGRAGVQPIAVSEGWMLFVLTH